MAVVFSETVAYRRFNGYSDPRMPEGMWFAVGGGAGDATGGLFSIQLIFSLTTQPQLSSRLFSLEQFYIDKTDATIVDWRLRTENMDGPPNFAMRNTFRIRTTNAGTISSNLDPVSTTMLPLFLGSQRIAGILAHLAISGTNVNLAVREFGAQGYWWGPRSVLADGGPSRPASGLYSPS